MELLKSALYFIVVLSVLVVVHEWGHFIVARLCKMRVEEFALFFGKIIKRVCVRNGTEFNIRSIPLGGFVRIAGMEPGDISNGEPLFRRAGHKSKSEPPVLSGLTEQNLEGINFDAISDSVLHAVEAAVDSNGILKREGRAELNALLLSVSINENEQKYIEAVLQAVPVPPDMGLYNQKPLMQRAAVIFAGPFMSLFFGYLLFCVMGFTTGIPDLERLAIGSIVKGKPADRAGMKPNDRILEINGKKISDIDAMLKPIREGVGKPLEVVVLRGNTDRMVFHVVPEAEDEVFLVNGRREHKSIGRLGFTPGMAWGQFSPVDSVRRGSVLIYKEVTMTLSGLFSKQVKENVGGIISIGKQIHEDSKQGPKQVLFTAAMLSVSLGIINLFPIPILDGGHLLLLTIEGVRRRKLSSKEAYAAQMVGISIIGVLFVLVMYNDIMRVWNAAH